MAFAHFNRLFLQYYNVSPTETVLQILLWRIEDFQCQCHFQQLCDEALLQNNHLIVKFPVETL